MQENFNQENINQDNINQDNINPNSINQNDTNQDNELPDKPRKKRSIGTFFAGVGIGIVSFILIGIVALEIVYLCNRETIDKFIMGGMNGGQSVGLILGDDAALKMNTIQNVINNYFLYEYDQETMENAIYDAMMDSLNDPYSVYYTPKEYQEMMDDSNGVYYGIGVVVTKNPDTKEVMVVNPYPNSPGEEAGIQVDDVILAADGISLAELDLDQAVSNIRGPEGTTVTLTVRRGTETFDVEVTRRKLEIITVSSEMLEDQIGFIQVTQFDVATVDQFKKALDELNAQGMKGLVVDIRSNPGGRLDAVCDMLDYILPEGLIVYTEDKYGNREEISSDKDTHLDVPCAVLVNGNSASASEIFAGAMQDYGVGEIIGTQTFGKGIVQTIMRLNDGSAIKLTVEDYYTPKGNNIHKIGITPDQVVELDVDAYQADGTDSQLEAAKDYLRSQMK